MLKTPELTTKIFIGMCAGILLGLTLNLLPTPEIIDQYISNGILDLVGKIFITILKMLVVPVVFVSIVNGTCNLGSYRKFGKMALKTVGLYLLTTAIAISLALLVASLAKVGATYQIPQEINYDLQQVVSLKQTFLNMFPSNPIAALASDNILQIIIFALLFALAINYSGEHGDRFKAFFIDLNEVIMQLVHMVIKLTPYGVFALVATLFAKLGIQLIMQLFGYFITVLVVLMLQLLLVYSLLLRLFAGLPILVFYRSVLSAILFAFSTASSNASIPIVLETAIKKLGVKTSIAAFIIPLGATINMDGTAIMQGVATVFIANTYSIDIGLLDYLKIILVATLASIGTAGIPSVGLITLTMVLTQIGLPVEGIALIIGVDRILDMTRTAVNITGDTAISCIVAKSEDGLNLNKYQKVS